MISLNESIPIQLMQDFYEFPKLYFLGSHLKRPDVIALLQLCSFLLVLHENNRICKLFSPEHLKVNDAKDKRNNV